MVEIANVNLWSVVLAGIASMVIGGLWYSPLLFGKQWMALIGKTEADMAGMKKNATKAYAISFVGALIMAYVFGYFVDYLDAVTVSDGLQAGWWIWLGFVATTAFNEVLFNDRPIKLYLINVGYYLVQLLVMGVILAVWT